MAASTKLRLDDLKIRRDPETGAPVPIEAQVVGLEGEPTISVLPSTVGSLKGLTALDKVTSEWPLPEKLRYVRDHVVDPPLCDLTADELLENITLWDLDMILATAVNAGGPMRRKLQGKAKARGGRRKKESSK